MAAQLATKFEIKIFQAANNIYRKFQMQIIRHNAWRCNGEDMNSSIYKEIQDSD